MAMSLNMKSQPEESEANFESIELVALSDPPLEFESVGLGNTDKESQRVRNCCVHGNIKRILACLLETMVEMNEYFREWWHEWFFSGDPSARIRAYHIWPGNNVFLFRGRLICGPDPKGLLLTTVSIGLSSCIFAVYVAKEFHNSGLIIAFSMILTAIVLINLAKVSTMDPGIIPRNDQELLEEIDASDRGIRSRRVTVNGIEVKLKYCQICNIYRPPRSCHCAICNNCVEKFDHHCPWIGQCIGLRNYRFYLTVLVTSLSFFIHIFAFSCWAMQITSHTRNQFSGILKNHAEIFALALFSLTAICLLCGLSCYHIHLIALNQTAYEHFRERYASSKNPYDKGIFNNLKETILMPTPASRVNFQAEVTLLWS